MIDKFDGEYRFLSNFWPAKVKLDGVTYDSTEHAYQAAKTLDPQIREKIRKLATPGQTKKMARKIQLRPDWETIKFGIMEDLVRQKFNEPNLKRLLLETGDEELIEGNTWGDRVWGVCKGVGENHLGKILMKIRDELTKSLG